MAKTKCSGIIGNKNLKNFGDGDKFVLAKGKKKKNLYQEVDFPDRTFFTDVVNLFMCSLEIINNRSRVNQGHGLDR